jgi:hypothetical protein
MQFGLPNYLHRRLQSVLSAAARALIGRWPTSLRSCHMTLARFHYLNAAEQIQLKLANIIYRSLYGTALG